jgi:dynein heavy chain
LKDSISKTIGDFNDKDTPFAEPILFTSFMNEYYQSSDEILDLRRVMKEKLDEYNDMKAQMNLVLFDQAI